MYFTYHIPNFRVIVSLQQLDRCTLPTTTRTYERQGLPGIDGEIQPLKYGGFRPGWVTETHTTEGHDAITLVLRNSNGQIVGW